jgi:Protein of unknown function (DUF1566)
MRSTKFRTCIMLIAAIGLVSSLSSCTTTGTGTTGKYGTDYLENMGDNICRQHPSGLMWQAGRSENFSNWEDAEQYVKALRLGGYTDWRLPTPDECLKLSKLIQTKMGDCPMETGGNHWVSKTQNVEAGQWESNVLCDGPIFRWTKDKKGTVKAVRP